MTKYVSDIRAFSGLELEEWVNLISYSYVPVECMLEKNAAFEGMVLNGYVGSLYGICYYSNVPMKYIRTLRKIKNDTIDDYQVMLLEEGNAIVTQHGRNARLNPGDMVIYEASAPFSLNFETPHRTRVVKISRDKMCLDRPYFKDVTAISLSGVSKAGRITASMIAGLTQCDENENCEFTNSIIEETFLSFLYSNFKINIPNVNDTSQSKLERIKVFAVRNIGDTSLCAEIVANKFGMSVRTLNRIFSASGSTFNSWLWFKRTEICFDALKSRKNTKLIDVIYENGFSDVSHFYRLFRKYYNCTPASLYKFQGQ